MDRAKKDRNTHPQFLRSGDAKVRARTVERTEQRKGNAEVTSGCRSHRQVNEDDAVEARKQKLVQVQLGYRHLLPREFAVK